jgi:DNA modification methylase
LRVTAPQLHHGDCLDVLATFEPASFAAFVDDPPAGIAFMQKSWDDLRGYKPRTERGREVLAGFRLLGLAPWAAGFVAFMFEVSVEKLRVAKPGAHSLSWALPRTSDLTMMAMRPQPTTPASGTAGEPRSHPRPSIGSSLAPR